MANDGYGFLVEIPSIFISYEDGEVLKRIIRNTKEDVVALIRFDTQKTDKALLSIWFDPSTPAINDSRTTQLCVGARPLRVLP